MTDTGSFLLLRQRSLVLQFLLLKGQCMLLLLYRQLLLLLLLLLLLQLLLLLSSCRLRMKLLELVLQFPLQLFDEQFLIVDLLLKVELKKVFIFHQGPIQ